MPFNKSLAFMLKTYCLLSQPASRRYTREAFQWVDTNWPCGKAPISYPFGLTDYFSANVQ
jgi:hypothetical protein